jgi:type IV pilus assembly protein PilN
MYSLDINFLNDRVDRSADAGLRTATRVADSPRPLYIGMAVGIFPLALVLGLWFFLSQRNQALQQQLADLDSQLNALQADLQEVNTINQQIATINADNKALATVFDRIKPWSAILQDIRDRVPRGVQVSIIEQKEPLQTPGAPPPPPPSPSPAAGASPAAPAAVPEPPPSTIEITGQARTFSDVNDFLLTLQQSSFLTQKDTRLVSADLIDNPTQIKFENQQTSGKLKAELPKVVQFKIATTLTDRPASELLQDLERTLAVGLPARIQALREKGVIQP